MNIVICKNCYHRNKVWHLDWSSIICQSCREEIPKPKTVAQKIAAVFNFDPYCFSKDDQFLDGLCLDHSNGEHFINVKAEYKFMRVSAECKIPEVYVFSDGSYIAIENSPKPNWSFGINSESPCWGKTYINWGSCYG